MAFYNNNDTITSLSTPEGIGAIAVIRLSGKDAIAICNKIFKGANLNIRSANTLHVGSIMDGEKILDDVVVSLFHEPHSYTGENVAEISCHGSPFIVQEILKLLIHNGAQQAKPGEFTMRAFMNGKLDLIQAESVADIIASDSELSHRTAFQQMRGGFSKELKFLREKLLEFTALIELELDFSTEDVEFADRKELIILIQEIHKRLTVLSKSFSFGNALKKGIPVVIAGKPNAGKSTLLNLLLNEEKAIVSPIPGTTRDSIEDIVQINGIPYRFIDTAGIREAVEEIETLGIERTFSKIEKSSLILYVFDISISEPEDVTKEIEPILNLTGNRIPVLFIGNKSDKTEKSNSDFSTVKPLIILSATEKSKRENNFRLISEKMEKLLSIQKIKSNATILTNIRHYEALSKVIYALEKTKEGLNNKLSGDLLSTDIRQALHYFGELTGEVTNEEVLGAIFSRFCVGK
ncbi:MAG: tRNA uridine-5-carboxymethylaminomethyl(34) synthesis GTPase MnmE [Bacteroidetes bacterium RIFCSPLOWO2_02_FULL_36_8]|nr:MAG: tRNA uridine-5-carboxymethylaminomethyl(34) synthesis GTPase MnmE [Bacteroidetes bacterium RIFCSPLOWO2_02_FULL_36_8]OFY72076.1 MAG: tRNA uridine-5-carboxymethylaminomethyl(34) synthesis GTPase MnmE [Bacteroidetes bacterium RIFCSPLOWO2_12_FULL_37_12]